MHHALHRITSVKTVWPHTLRLVFEDEAVRDIDLRPALEGVVFGPLQDPAVFSRVALDAEAGTVVWPNGADFDPDTLYNWPQHKEQMAAMARRWTKGKQVSETRLVAAEPQPTYGRRKRQ